MGKLAERPVRKGTHLPKVEAIRAAMGQAGMSSPQMLANAAKIDRQSVESMLAGRGKLHATAVAVAKSLGREAAELFEGFGNTTKISEGNLLIQLKIDKYDINGHKITQVVDIIKQFHGDEVAALQQVLEKLTQLIGLSLSAKINDARLGSLYIEIECTPDDALMLSTAARNGNLDSLGVKEVKILWPDNSATLPFWLAAQLFSLHGMCFALIITTPVQGTMQILHVIFSGISTMAFSARFYSKRVGIWSVVSTIVIVAWHLLVLAMSD